MANFKLLILASSLLASGAVFATYQTPTPPANWLANTIKISPSDLSYANGIKSKIGLSVNLGSKAVTLPLAYRFASTASRAAAAASFGNPAAFALITAGTVGYEAYKWYLDEDIEVKDGVWKKKTQSDGIVCESDCYEFQDNNIWYRRNTDALAALVPRIAANSGYPVTAGSCPTPQSATCSYVRHHPTLGSSTDYYTFARRSIPPYDTRSTRYDELTRQQFEDAMAPKPITPGMPQNFPIPEFPWPVEVPVINPIEVPSPDRNLMPAFKPERVPMGEPQKVPNSSPPTVKQPVVDITPVNKASEPFLVDVVPKDVISPDLDADGKPDTVAPGEPDPSEEATTEEDLCIKNPEILACQKLDTPDSETVENLNKSVTVAPDSGWGAGNAACPAARHITVQGRDVPIPFDLFCTYMSGIRPLVISMAWLSAGFILLGVKGGD